jgi:hypothetical protein
MPDNPASAALAEIRQLHRDVDCHAVAYMCVGKVPRLLKAVEAALKFHEPRQLHELAFDPRGNPRCGHDPESDPDAHYEGDDGLWYCESLPGDVVCTTYSEEGTWAWVTFPCPEYTAILAALTGKEADGGR